MTIDEAIAAADRLVPNPLARTDKLRWLSELDGWLAAVLRPYGVLPAAFDGYDDNTDGETSLLLRLPDDDVYRHYLELQIYSALYETTRANAAAARYNAALQDALDHVTRTHLPIKTAVRYY